jgi:hypothetical protein
MIGCFGYLMTCAPSLLNPYVLVFVLPILEVLLSGQKFVGMRLTPRIGLGGADDPCCSS